MKKIISRITAVILALLVAIATINVNSFEARADLVPGQAIAWGVDVSKYQKNINWAQVKAAGCQFAIIKAFSTQGKTRIVTTATVTTLNNKVAPVQVATTRNYIKETNVTTSGSGEDKTVDTDVETDTLNYGFTMEVLPRILDHGRLILLFNLSISDLIELKSVNTGSSSETADDDDEEGNNDD